MPCPDEISIEMQIFWQVFHDGSDDFPMASNHRRRFLATAALRRTVISLHDKLVQLAETYGASQMIFNYFGTRTYPCISTHDISHYLTKDNLHASMNDIYKTCQKVL